MLEGSNLHWNLPVYLKMALIFSSQIFKNAGG